MSVSFQEFNFDPLPTFDIHLTASLDRANMNSAFLKKAGSIGFGRFSKAMKFERCTLIGNVDVDTLGCGSGQGKALNNLTIRFESLRSKGQSGNDHRLKLGFFYSPLSVRRGRIERVPEDPDALSATIREHRISNVGKHLSGRDVGLEGEVMLTMGSTRGFTDNSGPRCS